MTAIASITLENDMDLILAYKKSIRLAELLGLTISTQTAFATAVSEVCREVIDKAFDGVAELGTSNDGPRFFLTTKISFKDNDEPKSFYEGFEYAKKLVPVFELQHAEGTVTIILKLGIPHTAQVNQQKVEIIKAHFAFDGPTNAYEEVKLKNAELSRIKIQHELALVNANYLNKQKDEFLSIASHELNSPLTILRSLAQLAIKHNKTDDGLMQNFLTRIELQTTKLRILIQQLLDKAKIESGQVDYVREKIKLNDFICETVDLYRMLAPGHTLVTVLSEDCLIYIDKLRIEQVMNNLMANAAKYSAKGSQITIRLEIKDGRAVINVIDQGIGLSGENISQVFKKFYRSEQTQKNYYGLGMGLYIASMIVDAHDGKIWVASELGKGSVFSFSLPMAVQ
jgi:signal transduction histidine kinase